MKALSRIVLWSFLSMGGLEGPTIASDDGPPSFPPDALAFFETEVRPLLSARCLKCHGPDKQKGGLRLDDRATVLQGGDTGPAAVPGRPEESLLVEAVGYEEDLRMPPRTRLTPSEAATLTQWVKLGLPWPSGSTDAPKSSARSAAFDIEARKADHWAWGPIRPTRPPDVRDRDWALGPIDRFILGPLEREGLPPAAEADRGVLLRRLSFDLTGLPPTIAERSAFLRDDRPGAYERLVERLLASPRFGERWGRHWLDLVRYAETRGHEFDPPIPNAWRYRDYVVRALNADVPFDVFLTEHIAGDLVEPPRVDPATGANESLLGTGFWFLGEEVHSPVDVRQDETDRMDNRLDVMSKAFLGLTVACTRCHDHKFDPISQRDYYALTGFLLGGTYRQARFATIAAERLAAANLQELKASEGAAALELAGKAMGPGDGRIKAALLGRTDKAPGGWEPAIAKSLTDPADPLHPFAKLREERPEGPAFHARLVEILDGDAVPNVPTGLVVDFGAITDLERWQNGSRFGSSAIGEARFADGPEGVRLGVQDRASAVREAGGIVLSPLATDARDHGRLGTWDRAGQTLRSPEFTLRSGTLWYLAKGAGRAYASVNSHLIVAGPLHAAVTTEWSAGGKGWRWARHDLSAYRGHRMHVEFCPNGVGELAVAQVVDSESGPPGVERLGPELARMLLAGAPSGIEELAENYEEVFQMAAAGLADGSLARSPGLAAVGDWMLGRFDLFSEPGGAEDSAFREASRRVIADRKRIAEAIPAEAPTAPAMFDGNGVDEHLLIRGSSRSPGPAIPRRFLEAIDGPSPLASDGGSGRLALAGRMTAPSSSFASRVFVNRVWHHLFGRGIVASVDNFGVMGDLPTHPELLDHLASTFMTEGWSVKRLVRSIVLSRAYRMKGLPDPALDRRSPGIPLLHRRELRRLEAEPLRDAILAVSGGLKQEMGGPSVATHLTEFMQGRGRPSSSGPLDGDGRRGLYLSVRRNFLSPFMLAFDAPIPFTTMGRRNVSNVPAQALILMNDPFVAHQARYWAERVAGTGPPGAVVRTMYLEAFAREPGPEETALALEFLGGPEPTIEDWADFAHALFNAKEFLYVE